MHGSHASPPASLETRYTAIYEYVGTTASHLHGHMLCCGLVVAQRLLDLISYTLQLVEAGGSIGLLASVIDVPIGWEPPRHQKRDKNSLHQRASCMEQGAVTYGLSVENP